MRSPKRPDATSGCRERARSTKRSKSLRAASGASADEKLGRMPFEVSAASVNCGTSSTPPFTSWTERFIFPAPSENTR